ncbi:MAG: hypothetical protein AAFN74_08400 [Myxococcota bacterium]
MTTISSTSLLVLDFEGTGAGGATVTGAGCGVFGGGVSAGGGAVGGGGSAIVGRSAVVVVVDAGADV